MNIVYWKRLPIAAAQVTAELSGVQGARLTICDTLPELLAALPGADGLVLLDAPAADARAVVEALSRPGNTVRWMHFLSAGREGFEAVGLPPGIAITYAAGGAAPAVAEHAMALLLALGRRLPEAAGHAAARKWDRAPAARVSSLEGQTVAIVGWGHIGQEFARRAHGFGCRLVSLSRSAKADPLLDEARPLADLHAVLATADVVVLAIALTAETRHLIDAAALAACKPGALLVNVARGGVIDQAALCAALTSGKLGGAGLDVAEPEPLPATDPLWACPNLVITAHFGGTSPATQRRLAQSASGNLRRLIAGQPLENQV